MQNPEQAHLGSRGKITDLIEKKGAFVRALEKFNYYDLFPPLGLEYIATSVKDLVEKITIIDMRYEVEPISNFLHSADVVGISINWPHQRENALNLLDEIPKEATVIFGGIHATENIWELLETNPRIDIID